MIGGENIFSTRVNINKIDEFIRQLKNYKTFRLINFRKMEKEINLMAWNSNDAEFFKEAWKKNTSNTEIDKKVEVLLNYLCNCKRVYLEKQDMVIKKSKMLPK